MADNHVAAAAGLASDSGAASPTHADGDDRVCRDAIACPHTATDGQPTAIESGGGNAKWKLTSVSIFTHVYAWTDRQSLSLGQIRVGGSVAVRNRAPVRRPDCAGGYYAIEPHGFVCHDATTVLSGPDRPLSAGADRFLQALATAEPAFGPLPFRYVVSLGAPMYGRIPTASEHAQRKASLGPIPTALDRLPHGHAGLADPDVHSSHADPPWYFADSEPSPIYIRGRDMRLVRKMAPPGSTVAFVSDFQAGGQTWLVTPDLRAMPADRVRVLRASSFHGIALGQALSLPIAWPKAEGTTMFRRDLAGGLSEDGGWPRRVAIALTGERLVRDGVVYLATSESNTYVRQSAVTVVRPSKRPRAAGPHEKWIHVALRACTLTAYEGDQPVFTTLISPGQGGVPSTAAASMHDVIMAEATPLGVYRIQYKDRFATLSPDPEQKKYFVGDVPNVQYFHGPFALHTAYWHDDFGAPKSAGCVNLAPLDGQWLFDWTEPPVPEGWQGAWARRPNGRGTVVQLVR